MIPALQLIAPNIFPNSWSTPYSTTPHLPTLSFFPYFSAAGFLQKSSNLKILAKDLQALVSSNEVLFIYFCMVNQSMGQLGQQCGLPNNSRANTKSKTEDSTYISMLHKHTIPWEQNSAYIGNLGCPLEKVFNSLQIYWWKGDVTSQLVAWALGPRCANSVIRGLLCLLTAEVGLFHKWLAITVHD